MNIGASAAAASMGSVYGARVLSRQTALLLVASFSWLGAYLGGEEVMRTISSGIIPDHHVDLTAAVAILACAAGTLLFANLLGIPLSTSEVTVGAVIGVGLVVGGIDTGAVTRIVAVWAILPFVTLIFSYLITRTIGSPLARWLDSPVGSKFRLLIAGALVLGGCYEAFAAGMNNVANAAGPLVAAGIIEPVTGRFLGGIFLGAGAVLFGGRVLETNGRKITTLTLASGAIVSFTVGSLVILSSIHGIPVPLTQATTIAIVGSGFAAYGRRGVNGDTIRRVALVWVVSPVVSLVASYGTFRLIQAVGLVSVLAIAMLVWAIVVISRRNLAGAAPPTAK